ncbi:protein FAM214A [Formica exsecta]|uniref:protein FAM214A n=1 Tax=Formica exsecta TaxID=72781 RepID=UPI001142E692|nr:protein FAM214A [Formica exsecta]XP_029663914.1 protein FAM214A [Formica exsecta]
MHCLGAVTGGGTSSPNGAGGRGGVLSVFRALGVLVCEGRIQGPPRGYKEGPHCAPPMQAVPNDHVCDENNYLCNRYRVLVQEIAERLFVGSYLCVEVLLCSDCPCGLGKSTCKYPVYPVPSLSISPWKKCASEMLLEYWCICVVPSKNSEPMNFQGLYQAVRSRLHFSQVAAWWSRSNGAEPSYIATRIVPHTEDNLNRFRETPVEHTFPLAGNGDGNSIKVTVWALPRMEEMPVLTCSLHPKKEKDEEDIARALTPTKSIPLGSVGVQNLEGLVLPVLVDDRLQTTCNKSGKHDCRCEEEDTSPLSPTIRSNGERKRRRSLPCGPAESPCVTLQSAPLPSVQEYILQEIKDNINSSSLNSGGSIEMANNNRSVTRTLQNKSENRDEVRTRNNLNSDHLDRWFKMQLKIEKDDGNLEKRCKRATTEEVPEIVNSKINVNRIEESYNNSVKNLNNSGTEPGGSSEVTSTAKSGGLLDNLGSTFAPVSWSFVSSWQNSNMNSKFQSFRGAKIRFNDSEKNYKSPIFADVSSHAPAGPYAQPNPFHESNPGPSTYELLQKLDNSACTVHQSCSKNVNKIVAEARVSTGQDALEVNKEDNIAKNNQRKAGKRGQLMWTLSSSDEKDKREEGGLFDWFSKVPGRVLSVAATKGYVDSGKTKNGNLKQPERLTGQQDANQIKFKNCNLELSQREVDEVLAVLRARTPSGRRRTTVKNVRKRGERPNERGYDDAVEKVSMKCANSNEGVAGSNSINRNIGTVRVRPLKSCEDCSRGLCKKIDHQVPEEQSSPLDRVCYDLNVYHSAHSKLTCNNTNRLNENPRVENADRLRNVSTKADVLLGAILRTTKDPQKGLSDISSNGTRSRSTTNIDNDSSDDDLHSSSTNQQDHRTSAISSNDEKSLPLNKRFHRFRQLFKKEMDKRIAMMAQESPFSPESSPSYAHLSQCFDLTSLRYNNEQPNLHNARNSRAKRRIDFVNFTEEIGKAKEAATIVPRLSTKDAHQNSRKMYSTNSNDREYNDSAGLNNQQNHHDRRLLEDTNESSEVEDGECKTARDIVAVHRKNDSTSPTTPQSEHSSSKVRNNNNKDDIVETGDDETVDKSVPSALEQERFRKSLENAASMVFHSRTGLPLTSSPAPLRRGSCCFDYDSSLNSVSSKRNALFELNTPPSPGAVSLEETDRETETAGEGEETPKRRSNSRHRPQSHALLGSFEESALNGRLEPVSTVHGFTAELGASGSFCPKHQKLPVTVFFYTLGDNDKVSTPYLAHINLEKKGYQVPRNGTIQVTLLNPLGTVVKMFVVLYDLSDMPPRSHTFLRQRTLRDKTLRYLVHLRFMSSKSGRIYLHTDIRMIICRKSDVDTASDFGSEPPKELRSYIHGPTNPKFSPRC